MEKNDIVYFEYEIWVKDDNTLYDTNKEELAKEHGIYEASATYGPRAIVLGRGQVFPALEESMMKAEVDKEYEIEIPPEDAFGKRDPKLVQLLPITKIVRMGITPDIGKEVEIDGKKGIITFVSASRVRVDFNHPMAGKSLIYKYKILKKAESPDERVKGIIDAYYGKSDEFEIKLGDVIELKLPDICKYDHRWHEMKYLIISDLRELLEPERIVFIEEYKGKKKEEQEESAEEDKKEEDTEKKGGKKKGGKKGSGKSGKGKKKEEEKKE